MASVYKRKKYAPIPANAVVVAVPEADGTTRRIAKWTDGKGAERQAVVEHDRRFGDRIVVGELKHWYIAYEGEHGRKHTKGYTDRSASVLLGERLEREAARRQEGITDQYDDHAKKPISVHLDDFMVTRPTYSTSKVYVAQIRNRIQRIINGIRAKRLHELDPVTVERFLRDEKIAGHTRNEYVGNIRAFTHWAVESKRLRDDPLASLRKTPRKRITAVHPRRALAPQDVAKLLDAALRRPLLEASKVRTGKDAGKYIAKVHPRVQAKMERLGKERWLCYMIAVWAGLRRSEIKALQWGDLSLDSQVPRLHLRAATTKAKRADVLSLHPQLVQSLREAKPVAAAATDLVVRTVPDMKSFRADLMLAGIDPGDNERGFIDLHCLRKTLSTMMASAGMSQRARQSHMRHTDPRLTENTYIDERLLPIAEELAKVPAIPPLTGDSPEPKGVTPGVTGVTAGGLKSVVWRLDLTPADTARQEEIVELVIRGPRSQVLQIQRIGQALAGNDIARHLAAPGDS